MRRKYVQDSKTGILHEVTQRNRAEPRAPYVPKEFQPFQSQVDGSIVSDRKQLADHNRRNGVTNPSDYGSQWFERKGKEREHERLGQTPQARKARIESIKRAIEQQGH